MEPIDYILLIGGAFIVGGIIAYLIIAKRKGKHVGCGSCSGCPHAGACQSKPPKKEEKEIDE